MDCLFCKETNKFHENESFYARWDFYPVSPGHSLIIPKEHITSLSDLPKKQWKTLDDIINETKEIIENTNLKDIYMHRDSKTGNRVAEESYLLRMLTKVGMGVMPDGYNIGFNEGRSAGQTIEHFHIHIIPRYSNFDCDPTGGIRNVLPHGNYKTEIEAKKRKRENITKNGCVFFDY